MSSLRSRHIAALGTLVLGLLLVVSPELTAFAGTCSRQGRAAPDAGPVTVGMIVSDAASLAGAPFDRLCPDAADAHVGVAASAEMGRWVVEVVPGPSHAEDRRPVSLTREYTSPDRAPPGPVVGMPLIRTVVLQV